MVDHGPPRHLLVEDMLRDRLPIFVDACVPGLTPALAAVQHKLKSIGRGSSPFPG